ncbi:MAG: hypothetical protein ACT4P4_18240 [Betaproteobacteria bacterium]
MRRSDHDVTDSVRTTEPAAVGAEVLSVFRALFPRLPSTPLARGFEEAEKLYDGRHPDYWPCDTEYHDIQHVLDVTLAMARLMEGYQRARTSGDEAITGPLFSVGALAALFHDFGYLRKRNDRKHRYGAEYTLVHVSRGAEFLRRYLRRLGFNDALARLGGTLVHFTGYERPAETIRLSGTLERRIGQMLGTADIIAQMSDRCYLEKCRDRLYPEFVLGREAALAAGNSRTLPLFASGEELVHKTPLFYQGASKRLNLQLARSYEYAASHFGGANPYLDEMRKNVRYAEQPGALLRRVPPRTLRPEVEPYPRTLLERAPIAA